MEAEPRNLRERRAQQLRTAILEAALASLEALQADEVSMSQIARAAGVSLRTLYRQFPDRAALLEAAGNHLYASLGVPFSIASPEDIAASFRVAARQLARRPKLARVLVQSRAGRSSRSGVRGDRVRAIHSALEQISGPVEPEVARHAKAVITHLCSAAAWVEVADEGNLSDKHAQEAVAWAIETLVRALRSDAHGAPGEAGRDVKSSQKELL